jgi:hypothetical protein
MWLFNEMQANIIHTSVEFGIAIRRLALQQDDYIC